jgi:hypothetical protein
LGPGRCHGSDEDLSTAGRRGRREEVLPEKEMMCDSWPERDKPSTGKRSRVHISASERDVLKFLVKEVSFLRELAE